ncbi:uncharacterized protein LOC111372431 [Olea europaea var. sylvestris]|uniref:uncharacterized protein LOC111372431 n=1 Tax=Olea europaea var. sylvestris TaxID=158386 RepID=UPI000C1D8088|nr:uncharacterized protein LOC111372431 [Olea europaea var. sylvestris]
MAMVVPGFETAVALEVEAVVLEVETMAMAVAYGIGFLKTTHGISDNGFNELLEIIRDMLPHGNTLPDSCNSTKRLLKTFDLGYEKIHACVNDCCLFRKDLEDLETCPKCASSRWKVNERTKKIQKGIPAKVLRHFPIIPRFRRMFRSPDKAEQLTWHLTHKSQDGKMRHPVDSLAWERIDQKWPHFASEPRNLKLGLSSDGFNPFGDLSSRYSCWLVILVIYNLPSWVCMSKENLLLTLLIPGPKQPGNDIDVYLQPLIEDLKELWNIGVDIYDGFIKSTFNLKAVLMWTIKDFPAYGNLSGYPTKGEAACPVCGLSTCAKWLTYSRKFAYMGHRRFLSYNHLERSLTLLLRHNLDVMHIEKNVCESILGTILNVKGKSKDGLNSRKDLFNMGIRKDLHPELKGNTYYLPAASYILSKKEKELFCKRLFDLRLPDGYSSNISKCISLADNRILNLKLCSFFNEICQRVIGKNNIEKLEEDVAVTLCMLERFFPPSFFDIMIHLTIHLGREVRIGGPVQYRWMYPFERFMKTIKGYVKNRSRPEGCIAERYLADECMHFCSGYMTQAAEVGVRHNRNEDFENGTTIVGCTISKGKSKILSQEMLEVAHRYVLFNSAAVEPYITMHRDEIKNSDSRAAKNETLLQIRHMETFTSWFAEKGKEDNCNMSSTLK